MQNTTQPSGQLQILLQHRVFTFRFGSADAPGLGMDRRIDPLRQLLQNQLHVYAHAVRNLVQIVWEQNLLHSLALIMSHETITGIHRIDA